MKTFGSTTETVSYSRVESDIRYLHLIAPAQALHMFRTAPSYRRKVYHVSCEPLRIF